MLGSVNVLMSRSESPPADGIVQLPADTETRHLGIRVVELVSELTDRPAEELPTLARSVDPEALNQLLRNADGGHEVEVTFRYAGVTVSVDAEGRIRVAELVE